MTTIGLRKTSTFPNLPVLDPFADTAQIERAVQAGGYVASDEALDGLVAAHGCCDEEAGAAMEGDRWDSQD